MFKSKSALQPLSQLPRKNTESVKEMDEGFDWIVDDVGEMLGSLPKASLHSSKQGPTNLCSALPLHVSSTELASWK